MIELNKKKWEQTAQSGEFQYHLNNKWRQSEDFMIQTSKIFKEFGFNELQFKDKVIIDLGAGSKLRTKFFKDAKIIAIEPLANQFIEAIEWSDLKEAYKCFSYPAEEMIDECKHSADFLISINVLDHCFNFEKIIENISSYLKKDGLAFLSFDKHLEADEMHPLMLDETMCEKMFSKYNLRIIKQTTGFNGVLETNTYGHGPYCLNYWLQII